VTKSLDLGAYLKRIRWDGSRDPTFDTLCGLLRAHMSSIPFENLDVLLGRPVRLDLDSIQDKLVRARRGGYCFEHTTLFAAVLEELGFHPVRHSARVVLFSPRTETPRAHMFLTVALPEGTFVVDPGFGGPAALWPVPLVDASASQGSGATHWMARDGDYWVLRTLRDGQPMDAWISTLEQDHPVDYEMANHFTATHPGSLFVNRLLMSLFKEDGRVTLMNRDFTIHEGARAEQGQLADRGAFRSLLIEQFGFDLPDVEGLRVPTIPEWQ
jgi:N-hydroxyarylamine O-acetyltransferase